MNSDAIKAYAMSRGYVDEVLKGGGSVKGTPCTIKSKTPIDGGTRITFSWTLSDGTEETESVDVMNGVDGQDGQDGEKGDTGEAGKDGAGITDIEVSNQTIYIYYDDDKVATAVIPTVAGKDGLGVPEGGTTGQILAKKSDDDNDTEWVDNEGGGSAVLSEDLTAAIAVGGISAGTEYDKGDSLETILRDMLEPTLYPSFTAPSASISYASSQYYAVGATVSAMQATVSLNRGAINPAYGTSGYRAGAATGYAIATSGADTEYSASDAGSGAFNVPALTRATKGTIVVTGTASYGAGEQPKDSKGNDYSTPLAAGSVSASKTLNFIQPYYYGASNSSTVSDFTGLTQSVTAKGQKTFAFTTSNQYQVMAYDSSYGNLKSILDPNGFETISGWTKSTVTVGGFSYYVYVTNSPTTDTNAPFTFKY